MVHKHTAAAFLRERLRQRKISGDGTIAWAQEIGAVKQLRIDRRGAHASAHADFTRGFGYGPLDLFMGHHYV